MCTGELALSVKYNTTQAVLHLERCQTRLPHQAMTSYIRTGQFTPHLIGFGNAIHVSKHKKYMALYLTWLIRNKNINLNSSTGVAGEEKHRTSSMKPAPAVGT